MSKTKHHIVLAADMIDRYTKLGPKSTIRLEKALQTITTLEGEQCLYVMAGRVPKTSSPLLGTLMGDYALAFLQKAGYSITSINKPTINLQNPRGNIIKIIYPPFQVWGSFEEIMAAFSLMPPGALDVTIYTDADHIKRAVLCCKQLGQNPTCITTGGDSSESPEGLKTIQTHIFGFLYKIGGVYLVRFFSEIKNALLIW